MLKKYTSGFLATCFLVTSFGAAASEEENIIKYRDRIMDASKYHISATGMILKGEVTFNEDLLMHAKALKDLLSDVTKYFPEGSDFGETEAKRDIWEKPEEFKQKAEEASAAATAYLTAVEGGNNDDIAAKFQELGKSCKSCHDAFREEDE